MVRKLRIWGTMSTTTSLPLTWATARPLGKTSLAQLGGPDVCGEFACHARSRVHSLDSDCVVPTHQLGVGERPRFCRPHRLDRPADGARPRPHRVVLDGEPGTGAKLASALRGSEHVRFEITEEPSPGCDGSRWSHTPALGIHHTWTSANGDAVVNEDRLRSALAASKGDPDQFRAEMAELLGVAWDQELEPFRYAGDGATVRWLHRVS